MTQAPVVTGGTEPQLGFFGRSVTLAAVILPGEKDSGIGRLKCAVTRVFGRCGAVNLITRLHKIIDSSSQWCDREPAIFIFLVVTQVPLLNEPQPTVT